MEGLRHPVGRQPAQVYWFRRLLLLAFIVLVAVVAWFLIASPSGDDATEPTADVSQSPGVTTSAADDGTRACGVDDVQITVAANEANYPAETLPVFNVRVAHTSASPCFLSTSGADSIMLITSGNDRIYSTADCPAESTLNPRDFLLTDNAEEQFQVSWGRTRSTEGSCDKPEATPQPGTYNATVTIQGIAAEPATFQLS